LFHFLHWISIRLVIFGVSFLFHGNRMNLNPLFSQSAFSAKLCHRSSIAVLRIVTRDELCGKTTDCTFFKRWWYLGCI
jgi:hypothetical protein